MRISVKIKPNSRIVRVVRLDSLHYEASVRSEAKEGKANQELIEVLSEFFDIPKSRINIISGLNSRNKSLEILT